MPARLEAALDLFRPGRTIYLPGASGESEALGCALENAAERMAGVHVVSCPFPGINTRDYAALAPDAAATVFLPPASSRATCADGRTRVLPLSYSEIAAWLHADAALDVAVLHVSPPDHSGQCSLGIAADFGPIAWSAARQRLLLVNPAMPAIRGPRVAIAEADVVVEAPGPLATVAPPRTDAVADAIGRRVAQLVPNGASVQIGLGNAPAAAWRHLADHRDLQLASGLIADDFIALFEKGAMGDRDHRAGVILGGADLIRFVAEVGSVRMAPVTETHDASALARLDKFTAINGAVEVDLFGQVNLEWQDGRMVSGVGGAPDFARGAMASPGGRSIIALPATARGGTVSRIVPMLNAPASLSRRKADTIVTEHGVAELRGKAVDARAHALIAIAAPAERDALAQAWDGLRRRMWNTLQ